MLNLFDSTDSKHQKDYFTETKHTAVMKDNLGIYAKHFYKLFSSQVNEVLPKTTPVLHILL